MLAGNSPSLFAAKVLRKTLTGDTTQKMQKL
jgi:hypothetical protein